MMTDDRDSAKGQESTDASIPKQVWDKYRYLTMYSAIVSTVLLILKLKGH